MNKQYSNPAEHCVRTDEGVTDAVQPIDEGSGYAVDIDYPTSIPF